MFCEGREKYLLIICFVFINLVVKFSITIFSFIKKKNWKMALCNISYVFCYSPSHDVVFFTSKCVDVTRDVTQLVIVRQIGMSGGRAKGR